MDFIEEIKLPILTEFKEFDKIYSEILNSDNKLLEDVHNYIIAGSGKKVRPILTLLSAKLTGKISNETLYAAFAVELLHTASLVHDDVVDDTLERRSRPSVNARWTNKVAVLTGDYILSKSLHSAYLTKNIEIVGAIANIGMTLSDGELLQLTVENMEGIDEELYFKIIERKTAQLFATCMEVGALSSQATNKELNALKKFGNLLGLCFQIKDDIFDYDMQANIGKPTGNDVRDGKLTLPLIYALRSTKSLERDEVISILTDKKFSEENIEKVMKFGIENGGLEYAVEKMILLKQEAEKELDIFENNEIKQALLSSLNFVTNRAF